MFGFMHMDLVTMCYGMGVLVGMGEVVQVACMWVGAMHTINRPMYITQ